MAIIDKFSVDNVIYDIRDAAAGLYTAPAYSSSATYAVGDLVTYNGKTYVCNTAIATAEAWTPAHWTETTISSQMSNLKTELKNEMLQYPYMSMVERTRSLFSVYDTVVSSPLRKEHGIIIGTARDISINIPAITGIFEAGVYTVGLRAKLIDNSSSSAGAGIRLNATYSDNTSETLYATGIPNTNLNVIQTKFARTNANKTITSIALSYGSGPNNVVELFDIMVVKGAVTDFIGAYSAIDVTARNSIAVELYEMKADKALVKNDFRIVNGTLYMITASIASGGDLIPGTNCVATTLADVLKTILPN